VEVVQHVFAQWLRSSRPSPSRASERAVACCPGHRHGPAVSPTVAKFCCARRRRARPTRSDVAWLERAGILSATAILVRLVQVAFAIMTAAGDLLVDPALASDLTKRSSSIFRTS